MNAEPQAVVVRDEPQALPANPMEMLAIAVQRGTTPEQLGQLLALQERWEANEARKAFDQALAEFKASAPELYKDKQVSFETGKGTTAYKHATLGNVSFNVSQALARHGMSHRFEVEQLEGGAVKVTCVLTHVKGHRERTSLQSGLDQSGGKNNIQALGSVVTYLQRYTLLAACGLATREQDDDGAGTGMEATEENELANRIALAATKEYLLGTTWPTIAERCQQLRDVPVYERLREKCAARVKELAAASKGAK